MLSRQMLIHSSHFFGSLLIVPESPTHFFIIQVSYIIFYSCQLWEHLCRPQKKKPFKSFAALLHKGSMLLYFLSPLFWLLNICYVYLHLLTLNSAFWDYFCCPCFILVYVCLVWKIHWSRKWHPSPVVLPEKKHGQRSLWTISLGATKSQTQQSDWACLFGVFIYLFSKYLKKLFVFRIVLGIMGKMKSGP